VRVPTDTEKETRIMCVGSKGSNPIKRTMPERIDGILADYSKNKITFALVRVSTHVSMCVCPSQWFFSLLVLVEEGAVQVYAC
jgi:hypothetical protein